MADQLNLLSGPVPVIETGLSAPFESGVSGYNPNVGGNNVPQDIWPVGGLYTFLAAAAAGTIVSTSANDAAAGTGAQTVFINGLDGSFNPLSETVALNGTTPVALANSYRRINTAVVASAGSSEVNEGDIDITVGGSILQRIVTGSGTNRAAIYTVPATAPVSDFVRMWGNPGKQAASVLTLELFVRDNAAGVIRAVLTQEFHTQGSSYIDHEIPTRNDVFPGWDIWIRCTAASTNSNTVAAGFDIIQV